jgi:nicotinate-nucleotide--dimethylbenzimidazole phosphoribosyltransferase
VAALAAARICPLVKEYMLASHVSKEPAAHLILEALGLSAPLHCDMCLGEGTGAAVALPLLRSAAEFYNNMASFESAGVTL